MAAAHGRRMNASLWFCFWVIIAVVVDANGLDMTTPRPSESACKVINGKPGDDINSKLCTEHKCCELKCLKDNKTVLFCRNNVVQPDKMDKEFRGRANFTGNNFTLANARVTDSGHFICTCVYDALNETMKRLSVDVSIFVNISEPRLDNDWENFNTTDPPSKEINGKPGEDVRFQLPPEWKCLALKCAKDKKTVIHCRKNLHQQCWEDEKLRDRWNFTGNALVLKNASVTDSSCFHCTCDNELEGKKMSILFCAKIWNRWIIPAALLRVVVFIVGLILALKYCRKIFDFSSTCWECQGAPGNEDAVRYERPIAQNEQGAVFIPEI